MRGQWDGRELRSLVSSRELQGRGTILFSARKPFDNLLKAKNQGLSLVLGLYLLGQGRYSTLRIPKSKYQTFCVNVCVCMWMHTHMQINVVGAKWWWQEFETNLLLYFSHKERLSPGYTSAWHHAMSFYLTELIRPSVRLDCEKSIISKGCCCCYLPSFLFAIWHFDKVTAILPLPRAVLFKHRHL